MYSGRFDIVYIVLDDEKQIMNRLIYLLFHIYPHSLYTNLKHVATAYSPYIRAERPYFVKEGSLRLRCCAQPDYNPTTEQMRETNLRINGSTITTQLHEN